MQTGASSLELRLWKIFLQACVLFSSGSGYLAIIHQLVSGAMTFSDIAPVRMLVSKWCDVCYAKAL